MAAEPVTPQLPELIERESAFEKLADYVSAAMGRPPNIMVWLAFVVGWTLLFALGGKALDSGNWMPSWFTSTGFNFPLNLITTVAELFIGFLVAAASNRSERNLKATLAGIAAQEEKIAQVETDLTASLAANIELTQKVHELTTAVHALLTQSAPGISTSPGGK